MLVEHRLRLSVLYVDNGCTILLHETLEASIINTEAEDSLSMILFSYSPWINRY